MTKAFTSQPPAGDTLARLRSLVYDIGITSSMLREAVRRGTPATDEREAQIKMLDHWRSDLLRAIDALLAAPAPAVPETELDIFERGFRKGAADCAGVVDKMDAMEREINSLRLRLAAQPSPASAEALSGLRELGRRLFSYSQEKPFHHPGCRKMMYDRSSSPCTCLLEASREIDTLLTAPGEGREA